MSDAPRHISARRRRRRHSCALFVAAVTALAVAVPFAASNAEAQGPPPVVLSPLPGTPDAAPGTQISFLGVPASHIEGISVVGSETGTHAGTLRYYSTHEGGSFVPATPFAPGERVTVSASAVGYGAPVRLGTQFTVGDPYVLPPPRATAPVPTTSTNVLRFHSRHDLRPPAISVATPASDPGVGDVFLSPDAGPGQPGPMIVAPSGALVWFDPLPPGTLAFDLDVQRYRGRPVLTWWQGEVVQGHGQGVDEIAGTDYAPVATVRAGNGMYADLHDFRLTPRGTAWITAYEPVHWDLSADGGLADGLIDDGVVQEIDVRTGLVMFEWHALGHIPTTDSYKRIPHYSETVFDYVHLNSVQPQPDGDLLLSARNTWATYLIDGATGNVVWQLGGRHSSFSLADGARFAWQHDAQLLPDGTVSLFDNESFPDEASQSRALVLSLDRSAQSAKVVHQLTYPGSGILAESQGNAQLLPNGDRFVGWGQIGQATEFAPSDAVRFDLRLAPPTGSYRAYRFPWSARPATPPALRAASPHGGRVALWASWNGATGVASWRVLAGASPSSLRAVGTYRSTGFETAITARTAGPYVRVQALAANGSVLRSSAVERT